MRRHEPLQFVVESMWKLQLHLDSKEYSIKRMMLAWFSSWIYNRWLFCCTNTIYITWVEGARSKCFEVWGNQKILLTSPEIRRLLCTEFAEFGCNCSLDSQQRETPKLASKWRNNSLKWRQDFWCQQHPLHLHPSSHHCQKPDVKPSCLRRNHKLLWSV